MIKNILTIYILFALMTGSLLTASCSNETPLHPDNYKIIGKGGAWGLQDKNGQIVLDTVYLFLKFRSDISPDQYYLKYTSNDGRKGIYVHSLDQPYIELGAEYAYLGMINSLEYFCFAGKSTDRYGNKLEGVIDKNKNIILPNEYRNILYYGGKHIYASNPSDKKYAIFDLKGKLVKNTGRYGWIYSRHGVTFASKAFDGGGDIWGAKKCLLDKNGKEITDHVYQNIGIFQCLFDKTKVYLSMRKDGIHTLYYPNGELIYKEKYRGISPVSSKNGYSEKFKINAQKMLGNKNIIGVFKEEGNTYYLTYEAEVIQENRYIPKF